MSVFDARDERVSGAADAARRLAQDRAAERARGAALARELPAALNPASQDGTSRLGRLLTLVDSLPKEAQASFLIAAQPADASRVSLAEAGALLARRLERLYPAGSAAREALGAAVGRLRGGEVEGAAAQALAGDLIARVTGVETPRVAKPLAQLARDGVESARATSLFEVAHRSQAPMAQGPPTLATTSAPSRAPSPTQGFFQKLHETLARRPQMGAAALGPGVRRVAGQLEGAATSLARARGALSSSSRENLRVRYGLARAESSFERIAARLGTAGELLGETSAGRLGRLRDGVARARGELHPIRADVEAAGAELGAIASGAKEVGVKAALRDVAELSRAVRRGEGELRLLEGRMAAVESLEAQAASRLEPPAAPGPAPDTLTATRPPSGAPSAAGMPADFTFTEEDLARIGTRLDPSKPPPQIFWTEATVNTGCDLGRRSGGLTDAEGQEHFLLAGRLLEGASGQAVELGAAEIAMALKAAGIPLEKVDAGQLQSAALYVSSARTPAEQQDKLRKTLDNFKTLVQVGAPPLTRDQMKDQLWNIARVPGHAIQKLSDGELRARFQEVLAAVNSGPGRAEIKLGDYKLKFTVGASGQVTSSECKKPGFFSKIGGFLKKVAPIALTVASFIPVTAPFARIAQGAISLVKAIQSKSLLGAATAAAGMVAGGATALAGKAASAAASTAAQVARVANGVARGLQGVSSLRQGSLIGGLAAIGGGVAEALGRTAEGAATGLQRFANGLGDVSTSLSHAAQGISIVEGYRSAGRAVNEARIALRHAEASGDGRAIAAARERLAAAESAKKSALLGGAASAAGLAADVRATYAQQPGTARATPVPMNRTDQVLRGVSRGLNVARGLHEGDLAAAGVNALGLAAVGRAAAGAESTTGLGLTDAANMADAALGYHQAGRADASAAQAVEKAERALEAARRSGDPARIQQAEASLEEARRAREGALMAAIGAGDSLVLTAAGIGAKLEAIRETSRLEKASAERQAALEKEVDRAISVWQAAGEQERAWLARLQDEAASPAERRAALAGIEALRRAQEGYNGALDTAKGDPEKLRAATATFEAARQGIEAQVAQRSRQPSAPATAYASLRPPEKVGVATVERGMTVWEISQRSGVPVERILQFNAQRGNSIDPEALRVGQEILVPLGADDVRFRPRTAEQIEAMRAAAVAARVSSPKATASEGRTSEPPPSGRPSTDAGSPQRTHDASADASQLYRAMHGGLFGVGTEEAQIYQTLEGRSPADVEAIRASYRDHYGRDLDADLKGELSGVELARAENLMRGNRAAADADALRRAMKGVGTDEATIDRVLEGKSPAERAAIEREYETRYGVDLGSALQGELSGADLERAQALRTGQTARADAAALHGAVAGAGTDEDALYHTLGGTSAAERAAIEAEYRQMYGRELAADLRGDLSGAARDRALALLSGQQARADAASLRAAMAGAGTSERAIEQALEGKAAPDRAAIEAEYREMYGRDLRADLASELGGNDLDRVGSLLATGALSDAEKLHAAVRGLGTEEATIQGVLSGRSRDELRAIREDYNRRYGRDLVSDLQGDLSGRDEFDAMQALEGRPETPEEALRRVNERAAYEREGLLNLPGRVLMDLANDEGSRLDANVARANAHHEQAMADGHLDAEERARLADLVGYAEQDVGSYRDSKDAAASVVSTVGATAAAAGVVIASGGSGTPVAAAILNAALAGAGTRVALSGLVQGRGYGWEDGASDAAQGAVDGATVAAFAPLGRAAAAAALRGTAQTAARQVAAGAIEGGVEGLAQGAVSGGAQGALQEQAWEEGVEGGLRSVGQGALTGAAMGAVGGALGGGLFGLRGRGAVQPDIAPDELARQADLATAQMVEAGVPPAQARELTENAVREMYPAQARQLYGEAADFDSALLRRPKGVPDEQVVRAQYRAGYTDRLKIADLPPPTREQLRLLADQRLDAIQRRNALEALEKAGPLSHEQSLALTRARAEITETSRLIGDTAADAYLAKQFPGLKKVYPPVGAPSRPGDFDQAWVGVDESGTWVVVEAKGGHSGLGGRWASESDLWFEQGSSRYFDEIAKAMRQSADGWQAAVAMDAARDAGRVRYFIVRAPIARTPGGLSSLRDIQVKEFDLVPGGLERRTDANVLLTGPPTQSIPPVPGRGSQSRLFYEPRVTGVPNLPAGYGLTNKFGDIVYSTGGTTTDQALTLAHERLHSFLSPRLMPLRELRADLRMAAYKRSELVRYLEEALAESYAQLRVNGISGLPTGIQFPIVNGYVRLDRVLTEAAVGTVTVGGLAYGVYVVAESASDRE